MTIDDIALTLQPRLGLHGIARLLSCMGTAGAVFEASPDELVERCELNPEIAADLARRNYHRRAEREISYMDANGIRATASTDDDYPARLRECNDYPHVLYYMGDAAALGAPSVAVVGTRRMTRYGQKMCDRIIDDLASLVPGIVIISGLAYGVDGASHRAALNNGLRTVGVLAHPLPDVNPTAHRAMARAMLDSGGALASEFNSNVVPGANGYLQRNRIIAGLSCATLVVESPVKGGSMNTARAAYGYDRPLMAIPGRADDAMSEGVNMLIRTQKAVMVTCAADIVEEMRWDVSPRSAGEPDAADSAILSPESLKLLSLIAPGEVVSYDELLERSGLTVGELAALIMELEFEGRIKPPRGNTLEKR